MSEIIKVGMADLKICKSPDGVTTLGLGSCVGIAVRDPVTKIGGLAHIMLPDSTVDRKSTRLNSSHRRGQTEGGWWPKLQAAPVCLLFRENPI